MERGQRWRDACQGQIVVSPKRNPQSVIRLTLRQRGLVEIGAATPQTPKVTKGLRGDAAARGIRGRADSAWALPPRELGCCTRRVQNTKVAKTPRRSAAWVSYKSASASEAEASRRRRSCNDRPSHFPAPRSKQQTAPFASFRVFLPPSTDSLAAEQYATMSAETVDVPETYLKSVYDRVVENPYFEIAKTHYETTKNSCGLAQTTLGTAENLALGVTNRAYPLYTHYYAPAEAQVASIYSKSVEGTQVVMAKAKNAAVVTGTLSLGAAVVATQMTLALGLAGTNVLLDSVIATKKVGGHVFTSVVATEQVIQKQIFAMLEHAEKIAMNLTGIWYNCSFGYWFPS
uniref:Perilipin-3 n=1 Tax=Steinernema glaseri TaxID=37863 RepID=A0A1I7ZEC2_9BILA